MSQSKNNFKNYFLVYLIIVLTLVETISGTYLINEKFNVLFSSIIYFGAGMFLPFLVLIKTKIRKLKPNKFEEIFLTRFFRQFLSHRNFLFLVFSVAFVHYAPILNSQFENIPINYQNADMIPVLKVQAHRFLMGEKIYAIIPEIWGGMKPVYLTFMWLPLTISEYFNFDSRWIISIWIVFGIYFCLAIIRHSKIKTASFIAALGLFLTINYILTKDKPTIILTEEGVVMGYYLFLGFALSRKNPLIIAFAITFCILSRYVLIFWLPAFLVYWYVFQSKKNALHILCLISLLVLITFLLPFGFKDYSFFLNLHKGYIGMAQRTWTSDPTFTLKTLGLAKFFTVELIPLLHFILLTLSLFAPIFYFLFFIFYRKKIWINSEMYALGSLKLTLVFFYNFLEMPYFYLFYTSTFFSYCLSFNYLNLIETE